MFFYFLFYSAFTTTHRFSGSNPGRTLTRTRFWPEPRVSRGSVCGSGNFRKIWPSSGSGCPKMSLTRTNPNRGNTSNECTMSMKLPLLHKWSVLRSCEQDMLGQVHFSYDSWLKGRSVFFNYSMTLCNSVQGRGPWLLQFKCTFFVLRYAWRGNTFSRLLFYLHCRHFLLYMPVSASCCPLSRHSVQIRQVRPEVFFMLFMCLYS